MELAAITEPLAGEEEAEVTLGERSGSDRRGGSLRIGGGGKDEGAKGVGRIGPAEEEEKGKKKKVFVLCVCVSGGGLEPRFSFLFLFFWDWICCHNNVS